MNKKAMTICSFIVGAAVFSTAAFADVLVGNGYYSVKESVKKTFAAMASDDLGSYTVSSEFSFAFDGNALESGTEVLRVDLDNSRTESISSNKHKGGDAYDRYSYNDAEKEIYRHTDDNGDVSYTVYTRSDEDGFSSPVNDIFEEKVVNDFEKVVDAGVGNLKDALQVEEENGGKVYYASLNTTQIPVFINALSTFCLKYSFFDSNTLEEYGIPALVENLNISEISGKAVENEHGILTGGIFSATLTGEDKDGISHTGTLNLSVSIEDIGRTTVELPDLTGENVEYISGGENSRAIGEKYIGTYKSDIVGDRGGELVRDGENVLVITAVTDGKVSGEIRVTNDNDPSENLSTSFVQTDDKRAEVFGGIVIEYTEADGETALGLLEADNYYSQLGLRLEREVEFREKGGYPNRGNGIVFNKVFE